MIKIEFAKILYYYNRLEHENEYKTICPFHNDTNASLKINVAAGNFFCFGCGVSGDALDFVKLAEGQLDDLQACIKYQKILRKKSVPGIGLACYKPKTKKESEQALIEAYDYYNGLRKIDWLKRDSLELAYMKQRGFSAETLNKAQAKINYNEQYPLIFPLFDAGTFKGYVCRTTNKDVETKRKYLYNEGFSRRNTLVGEYSLKTVVLVEGYMDRLKLFQFGLKNVVAILGWKITEPQISKLKKQGVENIICALDNDEAGQRGLEYLKKFFNVVKFQYDAKDPGDLNFEAFMEAKTKTRRLINEYFK